MDLGFYLVLGGWGLSLIAIGGFFIYRGLLLRAQEHDS